MVTVHYRRWCPPQSPLRIEFPPELLHAIRLESAQQARSQPSRWRTPLNPAVNQSSGVLFGLRNESEVRVLAAGGETAARPDGLMLVGTFVCRERGEVFLTDDDLTNFERHEGLVALVVAGGHAGFFVREPDGSMQVIRSHEEFRVADAAARPRSRTVAAAWTPRPTPRWWQAAETWKRLAACVGLLAVPAGAFAYLRPLMPRLPIALALREEAGQLVIGWNAGALMEGSRLEIRDGSEHTVLILPVHATSATYALQGSDVEVRLTTGMRMGGANWEAARFVTRPVRRTSPESSALRGQIEELVRQAQGLRESLAEREARTGKLAAELAAFTRGR